MRISIIFMIAFLMMSIQVFSQDNKVTVKASNISLEELLWKIQRETDFVFVFSQKHVDGFDNLNVNVSGELEDVLNHILSDKGLTFVKRSNVYVIKKVTQAVKENPAKVQKRSLRGRVTDEQGDPIPGANVYVKNSQTGSITDMDGNYALEITVGSRVLVVSFLGLETEEVLIGNQDIIDVALVSSISSMEEVVVVGYGTQTRERIGSAVAQLKGMEITERAAGKTSIDQIIGGQIKGVQVSQASGKPGAASIVRVRGITSPFGGGNNQPLYVIDGVIFNTDANIDYTGVSPENPLLSIHPADIETLTVLKDAGATAIYGSRGANGVIIITTKKGRKDEKVTVGLEYSYSLSNPVKTFDVLDANGFKALHQMVATNTKAAFAAGFASSNSYNTANALITEDGLLKDELIGDADTDWQNEVYRRNAGTHQLSITISGGSPSTQYAFSVNHTDQDGLMINDNLKNDGARLSVASQLKDWGRIGGNLSYNYTDNFSGEGRGSVWGLGSDIAKVRPDLPVKESAGEYVPIPRIFSGLAGNFLYEEGNPVKNQLNQNHLKSYMFRGNAFIELNLLKDLTFKADLSVGDYKTLSEVFESSGSRLQPLQGSPYPSIVSNGLTESAHISANFQTSYDKIINDRHNLNMMLGYSLDRSYYHTEYLQFEGTLDDEVLINPGSSAGLKEVRDGRSEGGINSLFSRVQYMYDGRYTATLNFRTDRSSKFGPENQRAWFPALALSWNISNEGFFKNKEFVDVLRIRGSWGQTGSANVADFSYLQYFQVSSVGYGGESALMREPTFPNRDIKWEKTREYNLGVDFSLWNNRLRGGLDVYNRYTDGVLTPSPVFLESGVVEFTSNLAEISNKGIELGLGADIIRNRKFTWTVDMNIASNRNNVENIEGHALSSSDIDGFIEGEPIGTFRGYKVVKIIQSAEEINALNAASPTGIYDLNITGPGDYLFKDINGDGRITDADREVMGSMEPDFFGGLSTQFQFKQVSLAAYFQFSVGNEKRWLEQRSIMGAASPFQNMLTEALTDTWTPENTTARYSRLMYNHYVNTYTSDRTVQDASYLRLKVVRLNYRLPHNWLGQLPIEKALLYFSASNLWTLTKYMGLDPENNATNTIQKATGGMRGQDIYPFAKTFTMGVSLNF